MQPTQFNIVGRESGKKFPSSPLPALQPLATAPIGQTQVEVRLLILFKRSVSQGTEQGEGWW